MEFEPEFRFTEDDLDDLRDQTRDESLIAGYSRWVDRSNELDAVIARIEQAFADVTLGDGIGLLEAKGIDDYVSDKERADLRSRDEWRRIDVEMLNRCYSAPWFLDARGFLFHLPAFSVATLNDQYNYGFIDHLIDVDGPGGAWSELLTRPQREAIAAALQLIAEHPSYVGRSGEIAAAIRRLQQFDFGR